MAYKRLGQILHDISDLNSPFDFLFRHRRFWIGYIQKLSYENSSEYLRQKEKHFIQQHDIQ